MTSQSHSHFPCRDLWQRDRGWHLAPLAPSPVDVFRLCRARCARDLAPGTADAHGVWTFAALVVRRRPQSARLCYADAQIVALPAPRAGWHVWRTALCDPPPVCPVQLRWARNSSCSSPSCFSSGEQQQQLWGLGSLCEAGAVVRVRGVLARTPRGGTVVDAHALQLLRCAPSPPCVARVCAAAVEGPAPLLERPAAMLALQCTRADVFDRLAQHALATTAATYVDTQEQQQQQPPKLSRRQRKQLRKQQQQQQQGEDSGVDASAGEPERKRVRAAPVAKRKKEASAAERAQSARRRALAAWARYLRGAAPRRVRARAARVSGAEHAALARVEALPCCATYAPRAFPYALPAASEAAALAAAIAHGRVDPHRNVPADADWRRLRYIDQKKQPQVQWMCARIVALLAEMRRHHRRRCDGKEEKEEEPWRCTRHIVDVGGGRGDLALAVAAAVPADCVVCVVDTNAESLEAGRQRAAEAGLLPRMRFVCDRIENVAPRLHCDLVIGLHACGGLSEYALRLAVAQRASFLVCTCCFNSHPTLAVLTRPTAAAGAPDTADGVADAATSLLPPLDVVRALCAVAERKTAEADDACARAMHAVNALRLARVAALFARTHGAAAHVELCQTQFDRRWSGANCVVCGLVVRNGPAASTSPSSSPMN